MPFNFMKQKQTWKSNYSTVKLFFLVWSSITFPSVSYMHYWLCDLTGGFIFGALSILLSPSICLFVFLFSIKVLTKLLWNYAACERHLFNRGVPWREECSLAMIYHVGNYSAKNFRSDLTSIWMFVTNKRCLYTYNSLEMQIFNIEIAVNQD